MSCTRKSIIAWSVSVISKRRVDITVIGRTVQGLRAWFPAEIERAECPTEFSQTTLPHECRLDWGEVTSNGVSHLRGFSPFSCYEEVTPHDLFTH